MKKVLLLDDERISHLILNRLSNDSQLDWQIRDVYFWDEASRLLQSQAFDLVLADVHLQNHQQVWTLLEGMESRKQKIPVVIITGQADEATLRESRRFSMVRAVIEKPVPLALLPQINQWVA
jgi:DNA-binding NtrC family response regulator